MPPVFRTAPKTPGYVILTVDEQRQRTWHLPYGWPNAGTFPLPGVPQSTLCEIGEPVRGVMSTADLLLADLLTGAVVCPECAGVLRTRHEQHDISTIVDWNKPKPEGG